MNTEYCIRGYWPLINFLEEAAGSMTGGEDPLVCWDTRSWGGTQDQQVNNMFWAQGGIIQLRWNSFIRGLLYLWCLGYSDITFINTAKTHEQHCFISSQRYRGSKKTNTFVSRVDPLCDKQAAGLWLSTVWVSDGQLVGREAKGVVAHLAALRPVGTDSTEHGLLLSAVDRGRRWEERELGNNSVSEGSCQRYST